jgi:hypothetical protein
MMKYKVISVEQAVRQGLDWKQIRNCAEWNYQLARSEKGERRDRLYSQAASLFAVSDKLKR